MSTYSDRQIMDLHADNERLTRRCEDAEARVLFLEDTLRQLRQSITELVEEMVR